MKNADLLILVSSLALLFGCSDEPCDFTNVRDYPSADRRMVVTAYEYCCYNTTGYDTQLHLRRRGEKLPARGNVRTLGAWAEFSVSWRSSSNVVVSLGEVSTGATNIAGITVTFAKLSPAN